MVLRRNGALASSLSHQVAPELRGPDKTESVHATQMTFATISRKHLGEHQPRHSSPNSMPLRDSEGATSSRKPRTDYLYRYFSQILLSTLSISYLLKVRILPTPNESHFGGNGWSGKHHRRHPGLRVNYERA